MDLRKSTENILEMLAKNEEVAGQLYAAYADRFPETRGFWSDMADDEKTHAIWIRVLRDMAFAGRLSFKTDRFSVTAIGEFTNDIKNAIAKTAKELDIDEAFSVALSIEESLIESKYFNALDADNADLKKILEDLETATREHAQKLRETWKTSGKKQPTSNTERSGDIM